MCAVIGYSGTGGVATADALVALFRESRIRGLHAFGHAYYANGAIVHERFHNFEHAEANLWAVASVFAGKHLRLIAHCRYSTSGDWRDPLNNQPLVIGDVALAFNGCIHMGTREEWGAHYGFTPVTDNDGEIFVRKVIDGQDWERWVGEGQFSFAGVMLHAHTLVALRNNTRPLWHLRWPERAHFIGSTADIFKRAKIGAPDFMVAGRALTL